MSERDFDEPFIWLLRAHGFYDIHFTHGSFEFGKDFVAKRTEHGAQVQYAFQSKAGDIGGAEWTAILGQLDEMMTPMLAHPNFDRGGDRRHVLVTTGILKGKAILGASAYADKAKKRGDGDFLVWDKEILAEMLGGSRDFPLRPSAPVSVLLGEIASGTVSDRSIEALTAFPWPSSLDTGRCWRALVDSHLSAVQLAERRPFGALTALLSMIRASAMAFAAGVPESDRMIRCALDLYCASGSALIAPFVSSAESPELWLRTLGLGPGGMVGYSVACSRVLEHLGLAGLYAHAAGDGARAAALAETARIIFAKQPGATRPLSDRYAVSLAPAICLLHVAGDSATIQNALHACTTWLCDQLDGDGVGLAGPYASPTEEVYHLLGARLDFVDVRRRTHSMLALVLADLAYVFAPKIYPDVVNDLQAVACVPAGLHAHDKPEALLVNGPSEATISLLGPKYPATVAGGPLPHHGLQSTARSIERTSGAVVPLAVACLLRDRAFSDVYPRVHHVMSK